LIKVSDCSLFRLVVNKHMPRRRHPSSVYLVRYLGVDGTWSQWQRQFPKDGKISIQAFQGETKFQISNGGNTVEEPIHYCDNPDCKCLFKRSMGVSHLLEFQVKWFDSETEVMFFQWISKAPVNKMVQAVDRLPTVPGDTSLD
jgi:hypothetical protein